MATEVGQDGAHLPAVTAGAAAGLAPGTEASAANVDAVPQSVAASVEEEQKLNHPAHQSGGAGRGRGGRHNNASGAQRPAKAARKMQLCRAFSTSGNCPYGVNCRFSHEISESRDVLRTQAEARRTVEGRLQSRDTETVPDAPPFGSVIERYYTQMFLPNAVGGAMEDHYVFMHSNQVCVVGLAACHPAISNGNKVVSVDFSGKNDYTQQSVSGKRKKGAGIVQADNILCRVTCSDGRTFSVRAAIPGVVIEVNERLVANPDLLNTMPHMNGYVALIMPKRKRIMDVQTSLKSLAEYRVLRGSSAVVPAAGSADAPASSTT